MTGLILTLAAAGVGYCYYRGRQARNTRLSSRHDLTRWEGEGGNVPSVATPLPNPTPQSSHPAEPDGTRH